MIKYLTPRSKKEIRMNRIKDFFVFKGIKHYKHCMWFLFHRKYIWIRTSVLLENQKDWKETSRAEKWGSHDNPERKCNDNPERKCKEKWQQTYDYTYATLLGETQKTSACVYVQETEWKRTWLGMSVPFFDKTIRRYIEVWFTPGIGDSCTKKCVGCNYEMRKDEKPLDTLRRMELERRFI